MTYVPTAAPRAPKLRVLHVASEVTPFSKTGGLADVVAALPAALQRQGIASVVVTPRYPCVDPAKFALARRLEPIVVPLGRRSERVVVHEGRLVGSVVPVYFLEHPLFERPGLYGEDGKDYPDNGLRFALLARAALELASKLDMWPDVVHGHDWQAGLALLYAKRRAVAHRPVPATVFTIHNLAFHGLQPRALMDELALGWDLWHPDGVEYYDQLSFLKAGLVFADRITTVSPRYAREILTPEHGCGLDGYLRANARRLIGILNGIDTDAWNPAVDPGLPAHYDRNDPSGKATCKATLQRDLGLPVRAQLPLIGSVSRLTEQKGFDLVAKAGEELARLEAQYVFLGAGEPKYVEALENLARRYPTKVAFRQGAAPADDRLAHRIIAGSDFYLMPSRFEPCGLSQLYALRYGTIPIVRATGGLDDTIVDYDTRTRSGNGFKFDEYTPAALAATVRRATQIWKTREGWPELVGRAMGLDHSWDASAYRYREVYDRIVDRRGAAAA